MTPGQLSRRVEELEQAGQQEKIFQFPELRNLLKYYFEAGYSDEDAGKLASDYYNRKYGSIRTSIAEDMKKIPDADIAACYLKYKSPEFDKFLELMDEYDGIIKTNMLHRQRVGNRRRDCGTQEIRRDHNGNTGTGMGYNAVITASRSLLTNII